MWLFIQADERNGRSLQEVSFDRGAIKRGAAGRTNKLGSGCMYLSYYGLNLNIPVRYRLVPESIRAALKSEL
jgi:hypothetical protein